MPTTPLCRKPRKARPNVSATMEAWWYEESNGISVLVRSDGGATYGCFIPRAGLKSYIAKRSKK